MRKDEEKIEEIKKSVFRHPNSKDLYMKRVPMDIVDQFKELSNKHFLGDYGMCLMWLVEGFKKPDPEVYSLLENHENRISNLEQGKGKVSSDEGKTIKMVNGRVIKRK